MMFQRYKSGVDFTVLFPINTKSINFIYFLNNIQSSDNQFVLLLFIKKTLNLN